MSPEFALALDNFVSLCNIRIADYCNKMGYSLAPDKVSVMPGGVKYIRIVREGLGSKSVHCFIDASNGDVLKAAGWKAPAKGARGNIFDAKCGVGRMGPYGPEYNN